MRILAIEQSSTAGSLALLQDDVVVAEEAWLDTRLHTHQLFALLGPMLTRAGVAPAGVGVFAVGLGPGSFTGLRIALATAHGLALPGAQTVYGLSSAEALAADLAGAGARTPILIVGDARRERIWMGVFDPGTAGLVRRGDWQLASVADIPAHVGSTGTVATADWMRLETVLRPAVAGTPGVELVPRPCYPRAATVARLAAAKLRGGVPSLPLTPLYLHPPVGPAPRAPTG